MSIPAYQEIMLPLLVEISDGKEHLLRDVISSLADRFELSEEERKELQPSGSQRLFDNRTHWARKYLKESGLLDAPRRAYVKITRPQ